MCVCVYVYVYSEHILALRTYEYVFAYTIVVGGPLRDVRTYPINIAFEQNVFEIVRTFISLDVELVLKTEKRGS